MRPLCALALVASAVPAATAADVSTHMNAAMQYWLAFELLPSYSQMSPEDRKLFDEWDAVPLTRERAETIDRWSGSLRYLHRGASLKECVWPATVNRPWDGIGTFDAHLQKAGYLARVAVLRARLRFERGRPEAAFGDLLAVLKLADHVGRDEGMIPAMVADRIELEALRCVALNLGAVADPAPLTAFLKKWDARPKPRTAAEVIRAERDIFVTGLMTRGLDYGSDLDGEGEGDGRLATWKYLLGLQTEQEAVMEFVTALTREYDHAAAIAGLPIDQIDKAEKDWQRDLNANAAGDDEIVHVFVGLLTPGAKGVRNRELRMAAVRAMLRAAVLARIDGKDLPKPGPDPFTGRPFEVKKTDGGYELRTNPTPHLAQPVVLRVRTAPPVKP